MNLYDLVDGDELAELLRLGYVKETDHPTEQLAILNYTDLAQFNPEAFETESLNYCRGLIYNTSTGEIVARPWKKFWNHGQAGAAQISLGNRVQVTDKVDGSLGILYRRPSDGFLAIATRGSFASDQAVHATAVLRERYANFEPDPDWTMLFEIVYPENRIVLDYGDMDNLILLGGVWTRDGAVLGPEGFPEWKGPQTKVLFEGELGEALKLPLDRRNAEGYVIRKHRDDSMVKLKQEDYKALHAALFGLNQRKVYESIMVGAGLGQPGQYEGVPDLDGLLERLPDEFHSWVKEQAINMDAMVAVRLDEIRAEYGAIMDGIYWEPDWRDVQRKRVFAAEVLKVATPNKWALFMLYDGKSIDLVEEALWYRLDKDGAIDGKVRPVNLPDEEA